MGRLAIYKYISFMILVISMLLAIFTLFGLFGGTVNPGTGTAMAMLVFVLPLLIIGNAVMFIYWLVCRKWIWLSIPTVALLCSIPYIGTFYQLGLFVSETSTTTGLKVATYNVESFGREISGFKAEDILTEMKRQGVDILCIQEYNDYSGNKLNSESYKTYFPYLVMGRSDMAIYSRYPLGKSQIIDFGNNTNNSGMWVDVKINGKEMRIFNVHLETTGLNRTLRHIAKEKAKGTAIEENALVKAVYGNYTRGMAIRAQQAEQVAREIENTDKPVIVCGDFNDVPYSYVYNTMLGDLADGFKECGKGLMYTMRDRKFKVRIDYIFHSKELEGETYYRKEMNYSDHYPVFMKIAL